MMSFNKYLILVYFKNFAIIIKLQWLGTLLVYHIMIILETL